MSSATGCSLGPVRPVGVIGLMLKPNGFFDCNPALDVRERYCCRGVTGTSGIQGYVRAGVFLGLALVMVVATGSARAARWSIG
jgi:hypothetical protein